MNPSLSDVSPTTAGTATQALKRGNPALLVTFLCWTMVVFDGYDLTVYGTLAPSLSADWKLSPSITGNLGSAALLGMLFGAIVAGNLADRLGRRWAILLSVAWFALFNTLCAVALNPTMFAAFRFLGGLGLGGLIPTSSALSNEYTDRRTRPLISTLMLSGVPIGGIIAASLAIPVLPAWGWRPMFWFTLVFAVIIIPLSAVFLPESAAWLRAKGQTDKADALEKRLGVVATPSPEAGEDHSLDGSKKSGQISRLLRPPYVTTTVLFSFAILTTYFAWFGLGTWLPSLMRKSGFALGTALTFTLVLYLGAVLGSLVTGYVGTRAGDLWAGGGAALIGALGLGLLLTHPGTFMTYVALVLAGIGTHGVQCLIIAAVASRYPHLLRGSALGLILGVGRIGAVMAPLVGGWLQDAGGGVNSNFVAFGLGPLVAALLLFTLTQVGLKPHSPHANSVA